MADEIPVCDVLCEAMEYLSKLGSNLRTRSEALKEKKFRKDKLKNAHAVQKAANKLLLICQLSKKSLENVENGVKKILTSVDASQASTCVGGKTSNADKPSSSKKTDYQYFEYRTRKLKVTKKVPLKHYMSVKVLARSMPISILDKYKVYYDCKLYRFRKRKALKESFNRRERPDKHSPKRDSSQEKCDFTLNSTSSKEPTSHKSRSLDRESHSKKNKDKDRQGSLGPDYDILRRKDDGKHASYKEDKSDSNDSQKDSIISKDGNRNESNPDSIEPGSLQLADSNVIDKEHRKVDEKFSEKDTTPNKEISSLGSLEKESHSKIKDKERESFGRKDTEKHYANADSSKKTKEHNEIRNRYSEKKRRDSNCDSVQSDNPNEFVEDSGGNDIAGKDIAVDDKCITGDSDITTSKKSESNKRSKTYNEEGKEESNEKRQESIDASTKKCDTNKSDSKREKKEKENPESNKTSNKMDELKTTNKLNENKKGSNCSSNESDSLESSRKSEKKKSASRIKHTIDPDSSGSEKLRHKSIKKRGYKLSSSDSEASKNSLEKSVSRKKHKHSKSTARSFKRRNSIYLSSDTDEEVQKHKQEKGKALPKVKPIKVIDDSDSDKEESVAPEVSVNKEKAIDLEQDKNKDKEHETEESRKKSESELQKPLIKLVNISKLLKPDILQKEQLTEPPVNEQQNRENELGRKSRDSIKSSAMKSINKNDNIQQKFKKVRYEDEEKFWAPKRKEVEVFKPKPFTINIMRVKKLSKLLQKHSLRKITKQGSVICELKNNSTSNIPEKEAKQVSDMGTVKKALLVDSDSDKSESAPSKNCNYETENVKNSLLDESDSGKNDDPDTDKCLQTTAKKRSKSEGHKEEYETVKNTLLDDSDSDRNDEQESEIIPSTNKNSESKVSLKDYETVKNTLLDESDSEKNNSLAVKKNKDDNSTQVNEDDKSDSGKNDEQNKDSQRKKNKSQSKRSNMSDTDSAKNNLLHDSDSEKHKDNSNKDLQTTKVKKSKCRRGEDQLDGSDVEKSDEHSDKDLQTSKVKRNNYEGRENCKETENDKNVLLDDSDSEENNEQGKNNLKPTKKKNSKSKESIKNNETDNAKNNLDDSDSVKNDGKSSDKELKATDEETENVNIDLLDSNSDKNDEPDIDKHLQINKNTCKRNSDVEETENVKNNLLEECDSVKNDDQDNNKVLRTILNDSCESELKHDKVNVALKKNVEENTSLTPSEDKDHMVSASDEQEKNNRTPDKEFSPINEDPDKVKSSLLNDSSDGSLKKSDKRSRKHSGNTPQSKKKHIMESMHAKKMLLTYSSSSDTEDEKLKEVLKEIKESLLKGISSDEEKASKKSHCRKLYTSSDSDEDIFKRVKKKRKVPSKKSSEEGREDMKENSNEEANDEITKEHSNINQIDGTMDETSNSSKMGRSREKRGGSSSHNSDNQDDKDVDGLTNLKTLNKLHRRSSSTKDKAGTSSKKTFKAAPLITGEGLLEAPISSDEASAADSDVVDEDLPSVVLPGVNGGSIGHLAKDDLLGDSDSSSSNEKDNDESSNEKDDDEDVKQKSESDTDKNVKSKRRKAHAISSDSEAESSRPKGSNRNARDSDFEDSGEDSEPAKKSKRKKKGSDSDASGGSSNEGSKKKRRRIKQIDDSDASGSDSENDGKKHGRKNIRKVMGKNQLEEATKKAAREEKERIARIADRQKMYNNLQFDESGKPDEVVLDKVVLDFDPETKEPLIEVDRGLVKKLKPHQANGIKFMWDACFESVKRIKKDRGSGCILAHCMGLGKTLQVVSLTHTLLTHSDLTNVNRVLVVCPLSTVLNWVNEYRMWLKFAERDFEVDVYELSRYKQNSERAFQLSQWYQHGGVCVLGYEMFRNLSADNNKKFKKKMLRNFQESLVDPGPDMVVCDEGHLLKNEKTSLSQSMNRVKTYRRIVLTGTPLQNNLKEYYCMVQFVKPNLLGKYNEYLNRFVNPITNGQYTDSTEHDIRVMKRRSHVLHKMLDGAVQRRDYGVLAPFLPPKHEYVLFITLTEVQIKLYQHYLDNYSRRPLAGKSSGFLFPDFQSLQRIWTHPLVLKYNSERYEIMQQKKRDKEEEDSEGSLVDFIDDDSSPEDTSSDESSDDSSDVSDDSRKKSKKKKSAKKSKKESKGSSRRGTRANPVEHPEEEEEVKDISDVIEVKNENPTEWWIPMVTDDEVEDIRNSNKLVLLFEILRQCEAIGDKLLVFSQSLYSLDLIEHFLGKVDEATQEGRIDEKLGRHVGSWSPGVDYFRLDGSTSCENRSIWCKNFNREDNPRARLFLISTRAGGLGINLVAANRVIIFDVSWNPSHDVQSIFRVYRFGQKKPCYVYRFLVMGTMEEKIYERQVTKQAISKRVIDEQQIDRHYAENDLAELYKFEPRQQEPRPVPLVPKDRLFAEMLKDHEASIYKFHEHDSLLENKEEETLSEEERKAAWDDFENEKNRPPPAPFPNPWPMHNGMVPNLLAQQQQQQLAYAALATMLRKDMPNLSDDQIRGMLPLIYGANPGLMQKLGDIYKYPQPSMMNPAAMMNSVMNPGGAMGGGGTSGLQYEPPWARDQRDQQNHRLQQLLQQQNQMGAKFYAGGLGSRDPVAMALQQQRAREIMLGDQARQRGRPPLQPRAPHAAAAAAPGDVVNLADSD